MKDDRHTLAELLVDQKGEPRPLLFGPGKLGIIWSAKSACTTVLLWYLWHCDLLATARQYSGWPHHFRNQVLYGSEVYLTLASEVDPANWSWLRVLRNPYRRAVSSYRHALKNGYEDRKMAQMLKRPVENKDGYSFEQFLDLLLRIDVTTCNLHHRVQFNPIEELVTPSRIVNVDKDDLMECLREIDATLETPKEPISTLLSVVAEIADHHHARPSAGVRNHAATRFTTREAAEEWPDYRCFLNDSTRAKIAKIYAADFARYADHL